MCINNKSTLNSSINTINFKNSDFTSIIKHVDKSCCKCRWLFLPGPHSKLEHSAVPVQLCCLFWSQRHWIWPAGTHSAWLLFARSVPVCWKPNWPQACFIHTVLPDISDNYQFKKPLCSITVSSVLSATFSAIPGWYLLLVRSSAISWVNLITVKV